MTATGPSSRLRALGERGDVEVACQLGDLRFGMGQTTEEYLAAIESVCAEYDLRLLCIDGNHENWARLDRLWARATLAGRRTAA